MDQTPLTPRRSVRISSLRHNQSYAESRPPSAKKRSARKIKNLIDNEINDSPIESPPVEIPVKSNANLIRFDSITKENVPSEPKEIVEESKEVMTGEEKESEPKKEEEIVDKETESEVPAQTESEVKEIVADPEEEALVNETVVAADPETAIKETEPDPEVEETAEIVTEEAKVEEAKIEEAKIEAEDETEVNEIVAETEIKENVDPEQATAVEPVIEEPKTDRPEIKETEDDFEKDFGVIEVDDDDNSDVETDVEKPEVTEIKIEKNSSASQTEIPMEPENISKIQITLHNEHDESVIEIADSPNQSGAKDATFSPVGDRSIIGNRPIIVDDVPTPLPVLKVKEVPLRTSTPLRAILESVQQAAKDEEKPINLNLSRVVPPSCLKSHRKRSLSVADGETLKSKNKVMFNSPANMEVEIESIDEKMLKSFMEEKENSIIVKTTAPSTSKRKRSLSVHESGKKSQPQNELSALKVSNFKFSRVKLPNFAAIHEKQIKKMESIVEHQNRIKERAKTLTTPTPKKSPKKAEKENSKKTDSKIPIHSKSRAIVKKTARVVLENKQKFIEATKEMLKITKTKEVEPQKEEIAEPEKDVVPTFAADNPSTSASVTNDDSKLVKTLPLKPTNYNNASRSDRHKNLFKSRANLTADNKNVTLRQKSSTILKGVRTNRRFELQMQHRMANNQD